MSNRECVRRLLKESRDSESGKCLDHFALPTLVEKQKVLVVENEK